MKLSQARLRTYAAQGANDLIAGATGAVAGIPQAMGFALIAGISPIYGLYAAIVATLVGALTSGTPLMTIAPTNALAVVVGSTLLRFDGANTIERMVVLTLLVGVFQIAFGVLRLGQLTRFVSNAVMTGFITGAAVLIILGQLAHLTGYERTAGGGALPEFWEWLTHLRDGDTRTMIVGVIALVLIAVLHQTRFRSIATLIVIVLSSVFVGIAGWDSVMIVRDTAAIPHRLPAPHLPDVGYATDMVTAGLALAVLASVQSAGLATALPTSDFHAPSGNRDLVAQGLANVAGSVFQGMPSGGSISRTAVNINAGARTRLSNILGGVLIGLTVLGLSSLIAQIVMAALAAHLIAAAGRMIDRQRIRLVWHVNLSGRLSMSATFLATLILPLEYSIYLGVALSLGLYVYNSASTITIVRLVPDGGHQFHEAAVPERLPNGEPVILSVSGNLYFAAVYKLRAQLPEPGDAQRPVVILRLRDNAYLGSTGIRLLETYAQQLAARQGKLILAGIGPQIEAELRRTGSLERLGRDNLFPAGSTIFAATEDALAYVEAWMDTTASPAAPD